VTVGRLDVRERQMIGSTEDKQSGGERSRWTERKVIAFVLTVMSLRVSYKRGKATDTKVNLERRSCPHARY